MRLILCLVLVAGAARAEPITADVVKEMAAPDAAALGLLTLSIATVRWESFSDDALLASGAVFFTGAPAVLAFNHAPVRAALAFALRAGIAYGSVWAGVKFADWNCSRPENRDNDTGLCGLAAAPVWMLGFALAEAAPYAVLGRVTPDKPPSATIAPTVGKSSLGLVARF